MWSCNIIVRKYTEFVPSETPKFIIDEKCFEIKKIIIFVLVDYLEIIIILLLKESLYKNQGFDSTSFTFTFAKELSLNLYHDNNTILLRQKIFIWCWNISRSHPEKVPPKKRGAAKENSRIFGFFDPIRMHMAGEIRKWAIR